MKLKNKLIPISSVLATTAIVVPTVLTSCSQGMVMVDSTKPFTPDFAPYDESMIISQYQATQKYVEFAKKNPKSVAEDIRYGMRQSWFDLFDNVLLERKYDWSITNVKITNYTFGINNLSIGENTVYFPGEEPLDYPSISFDMKIHLECEIDSYDDTDDQDYTDLYTFDTSVSYQNMIFFAEYVNPLIQMLMLFGNNQPSLAQAGWFISFMDPRSDFVALQNSTNWKIAINGSLTKQEIVKESGVKLYDETNKYNLNLKFTKYKQMGEILLQIMEAMASLIKGNAAVWLNSADINFIPLYASLFNFPTYYFGKVYMTPTIISHDEPLFNYQGTLGPNDYELIYNGETNEDTSLWGWEYVTDYSFLSDPTLQGKYEIGHITLAEDEDLYLPESELYDASNKRLLHIPTGQKIWDYNWYEKDDDNIIIRLSGEIVWADDMETPDGYSLPEIDSHEGEFKFMFPKRLIKVNIPIYEKNAVGNWEKTMEVISTVDIRDPEVRVYYNPE